MDGIIDISIGAQENHDNFDGNVTEWMGRRLPIEIGNKKYTGKVIIKNCKTDNKEIHIKNCIFEELTIKDEDLEEIKLVKISNSTIQKFHIFQSNINVVFENCKINKFTIERSKSNSINLETTAIDIISLEKGSSVKEISITDESIVSKLDSKDAVINKVTNDSSIIENMRVHHDIGEFIISQGAIIERFSIINKYDLQKFLKLLTKKRGKVSRGNKYQRQLELRHEKQIILAAVTQYEDDHKYQELDMCLVKLRKIDCKLKQLESKNLFQKLRYIVQEFVLGKMFGWGVKISNTLITAATTIIGFAILYFYHIYIKVTDKPNFLSSVLGALENSINRFFNVGEPEKILSQFDTLEQIVGVVLLTIITGILARKIIK